MNNENTIADGVVNVLVINDRVDHLDTWRRATEAEGWHCVAVHASSAAEVLQQLEPLLNETVLGFDATFVDVILKTPEDHGGLQAIVKAIDRFYQERFGEFVVASSIEYGDSEVEKFVKRYNAIRAPSPLGGGVRETIDELKERFEKGGKSAFKPDVGKNKPR
jgi:hypothetical protein